MAETKRNVTDQVVRVTMTRKLIGIRPGTTLLDAEVPDVTAYSDVTAMLIKWYPFGCAPDGLRIHLVDDGVPLSQYLHVYRSGPPFRPFGSGKIVGTHDYGAAYFADKDSDIVLTYTPDQFSLPLRIIYRRGDSEHAFPSSAVVPFAEIQQAMREFISTGLRPSGIRWQRIDGEVIAA